MTDIPDLWWSPTVGVIQKLDDGWRGYGGGTVTCLGFNTAEPFPADAVQVAGPRPDLVEKYRAYVGSIAEIYIDQRELLRWLHAELQHKLTLPCGECHPCTNWSDETWRRAGRKPPAVVTWEDKLAETRGLYNRLDDAIKLIEEMSNHLRQDPALAIGVETRLAALRGDQERWTPSVGEKVTGVETQTIGQPTVTGWFHSSGVDGLSWLKIRENDRETAQRYLVGTSTLRPAPVEPVVTPPDPSGRILDGSPVQPFSEADLLLEGDGEIFTPVSPEVVSGD